MGDSQKVAVTFDNQTGVEFSKGKETLSWGKKVAFVDVPAFSNVDNALVAQGRQNSWSGTEGEATWTSPSGDVTLKWNDPWGAGGNSVTVSGDKDFKKVFTASVTKPGSSGNVTVTLTVKPK